MNERIKQLALKSGFAYEPVKDQLGVSGPNEIMISPGLEKFAELIIRECVEHLITIDCSASGLISLFIIPPHEDIV
jgi:hypothetical protein